MILTRQPASSNSRRNVAVNSVRGQVINSHQRRRAGEGWELTARLPLQTKQWKKLNFRIQPRHERRVKRESLKFVEDFLTSILRKEDIL